MDETTLTDTRNQLMGKTISAVLLRGDQGLAIVAADAIVCLPTDAECCSETWFSDIIGVQSILGHKFQDIWVLDNPPTDVYDGRGRQEVDCAYGFEIVTDGGVCQVAYRNSSNGYYGGWCSLNNSDKWTPITEDWSA